MNGMNMRMAHGLNYELRNTLRSRNFWCYVVVCVLLCISGYVQGGAFDGAFGLLAGLRRFSLEDISMYRIIKWLMPHLLLSVYIGECGERDMRMQRLSLPRYASLRRYWRFQAFKLLIVSLVYYALVILGAASASFALGNRMWKISEAALAWYDLYSGYMPSAWMTMLEILLRTSLVMSTVGLVQLALAWFTGEQRWGIAGFAALMLAPLFVMDVRLQRLLPCDMSMYMRGNTVLDGVSAIGVCVMCIVVMLATIEALCASMRFRTIIVN